MSLDVNLEKNHGKVKRQIKCLIYETEIGEERIYNFDFKTYFSDDVIKSLEFEEESIESLYWANITHNLTQMASAAGLYEALWRPYRLHPDCKDFREDYEEEMKFEASVEIKAKDIIPFLEKGLAGLQKRPEFFRQFDAANGWGTYEQFVPFVQNYLTACKMHPESIVRCSR